MSVFFGTRIPCHLHHRGFSLHCQTSTIASCTKSQDARRSATAPTHIGSAFARLFGAPNAARRAPGFSTLRGIPLVGTTAHSAHHHHLTAREKPIHRRHMSYHRGGLSSRYYSAKASASPYNVTEAGSKQTENGTECLEDDMVFDVKGKITVANPVVELQGNGVSLDLWELVKTKMIKPYLDLTLVTHDISTFKSPDKYDNLLQDIIHDLRRCNVAVKCSAFDSRSGDCSHGSYRRACSPSSVSLRNKLLGALFVEPIIIENIPRLIPTWKKPIIVSHHVFGDQYRDKSLTVEGAGTVELVFTPKDPNVAPSRRFVAEFPAGDGGLCLGMYASQSSVTSFARCCFRYCILHRLPLYMSVKNPKMSTYDGVFQCAFNDIYEQEFRPEFERLGLWYETRKFDHMVSDVLRSEGGFLWACKNYDGDVNTDLVNAGFGPLGLVTYTYLSQDHQTSIVEPGHNTMQAAMPDDGSDSTLTGNPLSTIFTWTRSLRLRAKLDDNPRLQQFCSDLEAACIETVESGVYTRDLMAYMDHAYVPVAGVDYLCTEDFLDVVLKTLKVKLVTFQAPKRFAASSHRLSELSW
ncbi:NADP-dependent isocitrate dehydrogenase [Babesia caballi]|uniref:NADP-dependent isocitrate dehydrogenase n=1 Tax=Babesia caballi TaxID=5871 RepID=A0AAV4LM69_BABCB|nr:NADP-dependent isocitrate dehydrogenase [Babesia caballi]